MALIYKKPLSIKYASLSNGKFINIINVNAKRIGDSAGNIILGKLRKLREEAEKIVLFLISSGLSLLGFTHFCFS